MFRKDIRVKNFSNVKNSERKHLFRDLNLEVAPVIKKSVFNTSLTKNGLIYADNDIKPIFFTLDEYPNYLIPSIYFLWEHPFFLPKVKTHDVVIKGHLLNGASLMLPGTIPPFDDDRLVKGQLVSVVSKENDLAAVCVGVLEMDLKNVEKVYGTTGVAVKILHYYNDELFRLYDKEIVKIPKREELAEKLEAERVMKEQQEQQQALQQEQEKHEEPKDHDTHEESIEEVAETLTKLSVTDIDYFFHRSLLYTLTQESNLKPPISSSNFMSNYIYKNLPIANVTIKNSSFKKTSKWLKNLEKKQYLKLKGKDEDLTIIEILKNKEKDDELKNFVPYKINKNNIPRASGSNNGSNNNNNSSSSSNGNSNNSLCAVYYFRPQAKTRLFFESLELSPTQYYLQPELKKFLEFYIKKNNLTSPKSPKQVILDDILSSMIKSQNSTIARDQIFTIFLKNFSRFYKIVDSNAKQNDIDEEEGFYKGEIPKIKIITEPSVGNKTTTKIQHVNFEIFKINIKEFSKNLKVKASSSTTLTTLDKGITELMVLGSHEKIILDMLTKNYGLNSSWIECQNKIKNKRRKK
ncbi:hypothetical protein PACTADRAFT_52541 [Pachysolen tannophilus NRRL Y-2460]|uniref:Translation machinery-associated protein 64 n=1 Tax=Pachysolen tannophilus NRRL Y-2460 TaxID=669874 RepID=A0A1E4U143_PACTA|nr:hypothetical protein PACTADRAFT_52541 [Pachysolen tannophilus NRRL Y-2460]